MFGKVYKVHLASEVAERVRKLVEMETAGENLESDNYVNPEPASLTLYSLKLPSPKPDNLYKH